MFLIHFLKNKQSQIWFLKSKYTLKLKTIPKTNDIESLKIKEQTRNVKGKCTLEEIKDNVTIRKSIIQKH